jgi:hypothetical protein
MNQESRRFFIVILKESYEHIGIRSLQDDIFDIRHCESNEVD